MGGNVVGCSQGLGAKQPYTALNNQHFLSSRPIKQTRKGNPGEMKNGTILDDTCVSAEPNPKRDKDSLFKLANGVAVFITA